MFGNQRSDANEESPCLELIPRSGKHETWTRQFRHGLSFRPALNAAIERREQPPFSARRGSLSHRQRLAILTAERRPSTEGQCSQPVRSCRKLESDDRSPGESE